MTARLGRRTGSSRAAAPPAISSHPSITRVRRAAASRRRAQDWGCEADRGIGIGSGSSAGPEGGETARASFLSPLRKAEAVIQLRQGPAIRTRLDESALQPWRRTEREERAQRFNTVARPSGGPRKTTFRGVRR